MDALKQEVIAKTIAIEKSRNQVLEQEPREVELLLFQHDGLPIVDVDLCTCCVEAITVDHALAQEHAPDHLLQVNVDGTGARHDSQKIT